MIVQRFNGIGLCAAVMSAFAWVGCSQEKKCCPSKSAGDERMNGDMLHHVMLPAGFRPLDRLEPPVGDEDEYAGWPRYIVCERDDMIMAYVPAQTILMGGGLGSDEVPARKAVVSHFYIDIHEVSNVQFARFVGRAGSGSEGGARHSFAQYWAPGHNDQHPARNMSWFAARDYARWAKKSLPTEAQWESAARGGDDHRLYPWGNEEQSEVTV
jgi:hypothetical protein